jgi:hypothetical protein
MFTEKEKLGTVFGSWDKALEFCNSGSCLCLSCIPIQEFWFEFGLVMCTAHAKWPSLSSGEIGPLPVERDGDADVRSPCSHARGGLPPRRRGRQARARARGTPTTYVPWHLHELIVGGCRDRRKFSVQTGGSSRGFRVCCCSPPPGNCSARHTAPFGHGSLLTPPFRRPGLSPRPQLPRHRMDVDWIPEEQGNELRKKSQAEVVFYPAFCHGPIMEGGEVAASVMRRDGNVNEDCCSDVDGHRHTGQWIKNRECNYWLITAY